MRRVCCSVLLDQDPRKRNRDGEVRVAPHPSQRRLSVTQLTRIAVAVAGLPEAKPNLPGARPRRRKGGPQTAAVSRISRCGVPRFDSTAALHRVTTHRGGERVGACPTRPPTGHTVRRQPRIIPCAAAIGFSRALHRDPRPGSLCLPVPPQPQVSF